MKIIWHFLNPIAWYRAFQFKKAQSKFEKSSYDLELYLYSKILNNDMLHYGYFEDTSIDPESISLYLLEQAQVKYAQNILDEIEPKQQPILDVGCGMGGLANMIHDKGLEVHCLTPNKNQITHIKNKYPSLKTYHMKFEELMSESKYGTIINSESLQYIELETAVHRIKNLLTAEGKWIVVDYFRKEKAGHDSGHIYAEFVSLLESNNFKITLQRDITDHVLPTLAFVNMYVERFLLPLKHFGGEKLRFKKPMLYFMTKALRMKLDEKVNKERQAIDIEEFRKNKHYLFLVIEHL